MNTEQRIAELRSDRANLRDGAQRALLAEDWEALAELALALHGTERALGALLDVESLLESSPDSSRDTRSQIAQTSYGALVPGWAPENVE